jgi:hypothetical protein
MLIVAPPDDVHAAFTAPVTEAELTAPAEETVPQVETPLKSPSSTLPDGFDRD